MGEPLRILVIEDNHADFRLIERHLRQQDLNARCTRVDGIEALDRAITEEKWDLILSDYSVPRLNFLDSFALIQSRVPELPVILISGSVGEEKAADLLKMGVWDFVLKESLTRLVPAIERSLRDAAERLARKRAEESLRKSEERFNLAMRGTNDGLWDWNLKTGELFYSPRWKAILGYADDELENRYDSWERLLHPEDLAPTLARLHDFLEGRAPKYEVEFRMLHKAGHYVDILSRGFLLYGDQGEAVRVVGTHVDITERKRTFVAIRESENRYRSLFDNMLEGFASCRMIRDQAGLPLDFVYLDVNKAFEGLTGLGDVVGKRVSEVIPGIRDSNPDLLERYDRVAQTGQPDCFETFVPPLGIWFSISVYSTEQGCFIAVFDNITARKNAEAAQKNTIDLLRICNGARSSRELMGDLVAYLQRLSGCEAVGVRLREGDDFPYFETRGFTEDFVLVENSLCAFDQAGEMMRDSAGHPALDCMCGNVLSGRIDPAKPFFTERGSFWSSCTSELLASTAESDRLAKTRNRCNGEGYESVALIPLCLQGETFGLFQFNDRRKGLFSAEKIALLEDLVAYVTIALAKLQIDEKFIESNERFRMIFEHSIDAIMLTRTDGSILAANPESCRIFAMSEEELCRAGRAGLVDMTDPRATKLLEERNLTGRCRGEITMIRGDGSRFPAEISSAVFSDKEGIQKTSLVIRDVTERRNLEHQLRQSQKMEAVGTLAGGIAHDFNNILTAIIGYSTLLQMEMEGAGKVQEYADNLLALSERASSLTKGLLAFSRKQLMTPGMVSLNEIVTSFTRLIGRLIGENITVETRLSTSGMTILADYGQIEQVLMNLATNARDAMPGGGRLLIETDRVNLEPDDQRLAEAGEPGPYALLSVSDTGSGMDEETRARIFEPFFTTKDTGKGTGLGLSIIYGIVSQHRGFVSVSSLPGCGTTVNVYLPSVEPADQAVRTESPAPVAGGSETILIAEDDPASRTIIKQVLQQFGYRVVEAADGEEAVAIFRGSNDAIPLVILDVVMPRKNGKEAFDAIVKINPDVSALFISGYAADFHVQGGLLPEGMLFLPKPVSPRDLLRSIRQLLDGQAAADRGRRG